MYILDISRSFFFFEMTFEINHKNSPHWWKIGCLLGVEINLDHIVVRVISNTAIYRVDSSVKGEVFTFVCESLYQGPVCAEY